MAYYAALVSLIQLLKDITHPDRYPNLFLDKHQLHVPLYIKFKLLLKILDDYSPKYHKEESNYILERRIRDVAYHAQDMIESRISTTLLAHVHHLEKQTSGVERLGRLWASMLRRLSDPSSGHVPDNTGENEYYQDLEKVKTEVESVVLELTRMKAESNTVHEDLQPNSCISVETSRVQAPSGKNTMLVFDEDLKTTIKAQLCGESFRLEVISIAGMGGLGKTTLARNIFDDKLIYDCFDSRAWVAVSQDYHLKTILLAIVDSLNINEEELEKKIKKEEELDGDGVAALKQHIYQNLFGRRYLIVMDDVWEAKFWDDIKRIFPDNSNGSRIMITTRLSDLIVYANSSKFHHHMQLLDEDQSWTLLPAKVFAAQEHCPKELEVIGKKIAKNCRGLPLAIVVIAGVLSNVNRAQHDWKNIAKKVSSTAIDKNDEHLSTILSLSYNHLPHHLKPCFLYLGGFPEDHEIRISKLIRLWVSEGFLKPIESKCFEKVGEEYFNDLVNRNLVLITKKKSNGKSKFCTIHDILRELCSRIAHDENFLPCVQQKDDFQRVPIGDVRRVYIQTNDAYFKLLRFMKHGIHGPHLTYFSRKLVRILDTKARIRPSGNARKILELLHSMARKAHNIIELPHSNGSDRIFGLLDSENFIELVDVSSEKIVELLGLRYLNLTFHVPSRISYLQNLQTLICDSYASLPSEIWKMPQLRHVMSKAGVTLPSIPYDEVRIIDEVPLLGNLQTLSKVRAPGLFRFTRDTVAMIPNLKKLGLQCDCQACKKWEEHGLRILVHLHQLETLYISFEDVKWDAMPLPRNFTFPSTLIKLSLVNTKLPWKDMSVVGSLPDLQVLKLRHDAFLGEEWEPIEGEFLQLKFLLMESLRDLKCWRAENTNFPRLEHLHITHCHALEEIPPEIGDIPTLQLIKLNVWYKSNPALESSALEIQQQQRDLGNDDLQVQVIHYGR